MLLAYLRELSTEAKHLVCYSDSCGGQNRNRFIVCLWLRLVSNPKTSYEVIDYKFMISGHWFLPSDHDFGVIEPARRHSNQIYLPEGWFDLVRNACRKNPFVVCEMKLEDMVGIKALKSFVVNRKVNTLKNQVSGWKYTGFGLRSLSHLCSSIDTQWMRWNHGSPDTWNLRGKEGLPILEMPS